MINKDRLTQLTQRVIQFDTQNPPGNEVAIAEFIKKDLSGLGLDIKTYTFKKNRPNSNRHIHISGVRKVSYGSGVETSPSFFQLFNNFHRSNFGGSGYRSSRKTSLKQIEGIFSLI